MRLAFFILFNSSFSLAMAGAETSLPAFGDTPDAKIVWSERSQTAHGEVMRLRFHTGRQFSGHARDGVSQFFEKQLTAAGWHESEADTSNEVFVSAWQSHEARLLLSILQLDAHNGDYFVVLETIAPAAESPITQEELVRRTQELYDSIVPGNQAPWKKYFADDCIFSDEKGRTMDKAKLVADITPMPAGYSGAIKIANVQSRVSGDTAVLSYDLNETETIFGQNLKARYHITDTWLRGKGDWQIIASQAHRYYEDPAVGKADPKKFADFIGTYELAPGQTRLVTTENGQLFVERKGKKEELLPETSDLFFRKGVEGRILFHYADSGKIDALIDRRNNEDVIWRKAK